MYNTHQIIYRDRLYRREAYPYEKWRAGPGELVTYYLSRDFKHAGLFKAVAPYESRVEPSLIMEGSVDDFFEWDSEDGWKAVLTVSTVLLSHPEPDLSKRIVFQKISCGQAVQEEKRRKALRSHERGDGGSLRSIDSDDLSASGKVKIHIRQGYGGYPFRIHPRPSGRGFLRRRVK